MQQPLAKPLAKPFASHPVMVHRLAKVVLAPRKPNQTSMERYWETQRINQQQPRAKRRLESVSAPEDRLAKPRRVSAPVDPVVATIDHSDASDAISIVSVADSDDLCEP